MTNYRISCSKNEIENFNFCFSCGAKLEDVMIAGEKIRQCKYNSLHIKIWLNDDIEENIEFI